MRKINQTTLALVQILQLTAKLTSTFEFSFMETEAEYCYFQYLYFLLC